MELDVAVRGGRKALLVLTERVTQFQHIILIKAVFCRRGLLSTSFDNEMCNEWLI